MHGSDDGGLVVMVKVVTTNLLYVDARHSQRHDWRTLFIVVHVVVHTIASSTSNTVPSHRPRVPLSRPWPRVWSRPWPWPGTWPPAHCFWLWTWPKAPPSWPWPWLPTVRGRCGSPKVICRHSVWTCLPVQRRQQWNYNVEDVQPHHHHHQQQQQQLHSCSRYVFRIQNQFIISSTDCLQHLTAATCRWQYFRCWLR